MGSEEGKGKKKVEKRVESLGWLTETTIMPKKHKPIEGVGASSILELKAHLYKSQQESKSSKEQQLSSSDVQYQRAKKKISPHDPFNFRNSGVEARAHKDKLELKAVKDGAVSYAALERKAELYDKLARGELSDEEDKERYCVDFFSKSMMQEEQQQTRGDEISASKVPENVDDQSDASLLFNTKFAGPGRAATGMMDNDEHKRFVREVHEEANQAREKASELKMRRQEQATARREKLKQAYLRKQLEKLTAGSKADLT